MQVFFLGKRDNLTQPIQMKLSKELKNFSNFLLHIRNLHLILNILKMSLILYVFSKL